MTLEKMLTIRALSRDAKIGIAKILPDEILKTESTRVARVTRMGGTSLFTQMSKSRAKACQNHQLINASS